MNIKRYVAPTVGEALKQVREALGGEAVILANRPVPEGVEILAATSDDMLSFESKAKPQPQDNKPQEKRSSHHAEKESAPKQIVPSSIDVITNAQMARAKKRLVPVEKEVVVEKRVAAPAVQANTNNTELAQEIRSMRGFIEEQLSSLAWSESMRRHPMRMKLMQGMLAAGFSPALSRHLQQSLPDDMNFDQAREWVCNILEKNLSCVSVEEDVVEKGGVYALVGPTGVGKTTTTAKIAARFAVKYGAEKLALITTDGYRIGAQDQLRIYGKILGAPVHTIQDTASLSSAIQHFSQKRLILIDTAGMGQRDQRVAEQIAMLSGANAKRLLVLNATVQAETLDDVVAAYGDKSFNGCIISKLDEAVRFGGVLDVIIRHRMCLHYMACGQRVPEDLHRPNARYLIHRSFKEAAPSKAFALQEDDYAAWLAAISQNSKGQKIEVNHV